MVLLKYLTRMAGGLPENTTTNPHRADADLKAVNERVERHMEDTGSMDDLTAKEERLRSRLIDAMQE